MIDQGRNPETALVGGITTAETTQRHITLQVYENAGVAIGDYPLQAFIPLPYGVYGANLPDGTQTLLTSAEIAQTFVIKDSFGTALPAQYWVRSRWHELDNSIKELVAIFKATDIPAYAGRGTTGDPAPIEYFFEHGVSPPPTTPVTATADANLITVSNGDVVFTINKAYFNFLDSISYKDTKVINNGTEDGHYVINRFNNSYKDAQPCTTRVPTNFVIEEAGPVRARIRVERAAYFVQDTNDSCYHPDKFNETPEPVPGFVVWFDLYHDSDQIVVNHNILNNAITAYRSDLGQEGYGLDGWPLFFQESGIQ